jgi:hypothetical protein
VEALERKLGKHDTDVQAILNILHRLLQPPPEPPPEPPRRAIGFAKPKT